MNYMVLPKYTNELIQEIDVSISKIFKKHFNKSLRKYHVTHPDRKKYYGCTQNVESYTEFLNQAWEKIQSEQI